MMLFQWIQTSHSYDLWLHLHAILSVNRKDKTMATISYNRPVTINPDWGVKNLLEKMKEGDQLKNLTKEDFRISKEISSRTLTPEQIKRAKEKYSCKKA